MIALNAFKIQKANEQANEVLFEIGPLPKGYGHTLGNMIRRTLLTSIPGSAITAVKLEGVQHEYSTMSGLKEDVLKLMLSFKNVVVISKVEGVTELKIKVKGQKGKSVAVTAGDIEKNANVEVINSDYVITTLTDAINFEATLYVSSGIGYAFPDQSLRKELGVLPIDADYSPVTLVSYDVTSTRVGQETDLDQLNLQVKTNGAVKPEEAFYTASNILNNMIAHLFQCSEEVAGYKVQTPVSLEMQDDEEVSEDDVKELPVADSNLSTRLTNALLRSSYTDLNQLAGMTEEELANIKGMGQKSLDELVAVLDKHNVKII